MRFFFVLGKDESERLYHRTIYFKLRSGFKHMFKIVKKLHSRELINVTSDFGNLIKECFKTVSVSSVFFCCFLFLFLFFFG